MASILASPGGTISILRGHARDPAGHQRPLPAPTSSATAPTRSSRGSRRRDHAREADRDRRGRPRLTVSTPRSPAASGSTCSAPGWSSCPAIWRRLVDAGFESGHAYGKALRTVKSCVGTDLVPLRRAGLGAAGHPTWSCRYRGLALAAQAQVAVSAAAPASVPRPGRKDFGVIATEKGWNLYVGGNGGAKPRARRAAGGRPRRRRRCVRYIDRFLMYYIRTADRLQRTAPWMRGARGRPRHGQREVVGRRRARPRCRPAMPRWPRHVDDYRDEWAGHPRRPREAATASSRSSTRPRHPDPHITVPGRPRPAPSRPTPTVRCSSATTIPVGAAAVRPSP